MKRLLLPAFAALFVVAASAAPNADSDLGGNPPRVIQVATKPGVPVHQRVTLGLGKAVIVQLDADAGDVLVSNPEIVDAVVRTPRRIFLMAQKGGQTNAFFFDGAGRQLLSLDIRVEKDVTDLGHLIHEALPDSGIKVSAINDSVVLSGHVASSQDAARAQDIATRFAGDPTKVVNMLEITATEQVMLKVRIAEMQRTIAKQFGVNMAGAGHIDGVPFAVSTDNQFNLVGHALADLSGGQVGQICGAGSTVVNPVAAMATAGGVCNIANNMQGSLQALEQVGLVHMLAEPNLTAVSGETARFLAGGEFPVPSGRDSQGNIQITFKQFGVGLSFTPVVLSPGRISLQLSSEVSELTNTGAYTLQGANGSGLTIPALSVRRAQTTVELPSGGSFAIAGLMQHNTKQVIDAFPGLKDLPILGALFRSRDFENDETELVVMVTAYLVKPTTEVKLAAPTDGYVPPTDVETIFLGRLNAVYPHDRHTVTADSGRVGFIVQ
jgi:pilus assembly protein CpaC